MPTIFIHDTPIRVPDQYTEGHRLSASEADLLNSVWLNLFIARLRLFINKNPEANISAVHSKAKEISNALVLTPNDSATDPVWDEAMVIARELINARLATEGLPPPPNLDIHAEALLEASEDILDQAQARVEIRRRVANKALGALEITL